MSDSSWKWDEYRFGCGKVFRLRLSQINVKNIEYLKFSFVLVLINSVNCCIIISGIFLETSGVEIFVIYILRLFYPHLIIPLPLLAPISTYNFNASTTFSITFHPLFGLQAKQLNLFLRPLRIMYGCDKSGTSLYLLTHSKNKL